MSDHATKRVARLLVWVGLLILVAFIGRGIADWAMEMNAALALRGAHL